MQAVTQLQGGATDSKQPPVPIKTELKSEEEIMQSKIDAITNDFPGCLRDVQDIKIKEDSMMPKAKADPMAVQLVKN